MHNNAITRFEIEGGKPRIVYFLLESRSGDKDTKQRIVSTNRVKFIFRNIQDIFSLWSIGFTKKFYNVR